MNKTIIISIILLLFIFIFRQKNIEAEKMTNTEAVNSLVSLYKDGKFKAESLDVSNNINIAKNIVIGIQPDTDFLSIAPIGTDSKPDYTKALNIDINGNIFKPANRAKYIEISNKNTVYLAKVDYMSIRKVNIFGVDGKDVAQNATVTQTEGTMYTTGGTFNGQYGTPDSIIKYVDDSYWHGNTGVNTLLIELEEETDISQIIIYNIWDERFQPRLNGAHITLMDENKNTRRIIHTGDWAKTYSKEFILQ
jgi:hypothetical protein